MIEDTAPARVKTAYVYTLVPYFAGCVFYVVAGLRNPEGLLLVIVSAVAASLGGTSGFAWGPQLLRDPDIPAASRDVLVLSRNWRWVALGGLVAAAFVIVLGPGIRFPHHGQ